MLALRSELESAKGRCRRQQTQKQGPAYSGWQGLLTSLLCLYAPAVRTLKHRRPNLESGQAWWRAASYTDT